MPWWRSWLGGSRETVEVESVRKKIERMRRCRRGGGVVRRIAQALRTKSTLELYGVSEIARASIY